MEHKVTNSKCPICKQTSEVHHLISKPNSILVISQCSKCFAVWRTYDKVTGRLIFPKTSQEQEGDINYFTICPRCCAKMEPDFSDFSLKCPDPICSYKKRIPGPTQKQIELYREYGELKERIFQSLIDGKNPSESEYSRLKELQKQIPEIEKAFTLADSIGFGDTTFGSYLRERFKFLRKLELK